MLGSWHRSHSILLYIIMLKNYALYIIEGLRNHHQDFLRSHHRIKYKVSSLLWNQGHKMQAKGIPSGWCNAVTWCYVGALMLRCYHVGAIYRDYVL